MDTPARLTARGVATRERILLAAARLMYVRGVGATLLDDVLATSGTSKSQLYRHFPDRQALIEGVVDLQCAQILARERLDLARVRSFAGLQRWATALVENNALQNGAYGCVLGSMTSELAGQSERARLTIKATFDEWVDLIERALGRLRDNDELRPDADTPNIAIGLMAALQGGYVLARTAHTITPMRTALDLALGHVHQHLRSTTT
ncbi:TetR/AcrR family transcriptional regulator [Actinoplanes sp. HUAS TT8]|uniref:TetR/AcrR family transcriptional regulator n=1 Tax=Actinoplanes sp. HUAS TT8 TaxID=3447453 RepID=UPI003F5284D2